MAITTASVDDIQTALGNSVTAFAKQGTTIFSTQYQLGGGGGGGGGNPWLPEFAACMNAYNLLLPTDLAFYQSIASGAKTGPAWWLEWQGPRVRGGEAPNFTSNYNPESYDFTFNVTFSIVGANILITFDPDYFFSPPFIYTLHCSQPSVDPITPDHSTLRYQETGLVTNVVPKTFTFTPDEAPVAGMWFYVRLWGWRNPQCNSYRTDKQTTL